MIAIYEPKGAAREYGELACNLYTGCAHGCRYCYAPGILHKTREEFRQASPRPGILGALRKDAARLRGSGATVFLCFTCDPYQPLESKLFVTRDAIDILAGHDLRTRILTKSILAERDFDLFAQHRIELGVTAHLTKDESFWEPNVSSTSARLDTMRRAALRGIRTWISVEPVIEPVQALTVIEEACRFVGRIAIGKLNHDPDREQAIDWTGFLRSALAILAPATCGYYVKDALWAQADSSIRATYWRSRP